MKIEEMHVHTPFELGDPWTVDPTLRQVLSRLLASSPVPYSELSSRLARFSTSVEANARPLSQLLDRPGAEPRLVQYDEWGRRVDRVETNEGWRGLTRWSNGEGMLGEAYPCVGQERYVNDAQMSAGGRDRLGEYARLYQFARTYLFAPDSAVNLCPTSMSDGAVRVLELFGTPEQCAKYRPRLLSRGPDAWMAGQWMTERIGGSDISMTETRAEPLVRGKQPVAGDLFVLNGFKWFSSAADGDMSLALARTDPDPSLGSKGLSLFLVPLKKRDVPPMPDGATLPASVNADADSPLNGIRIHRLKNKLGTKMVPTAELELNGAVAELIGKPGRGVAQIASVLNITRIYSANGTVSAIGRCLHVVRDYAGRRKVGTGMGEAQLLKDIPMHAARVARVATTHAALSQILWKTTLLLGKAEAGTASKRDERRLRLLTPVAKAFAATRGTECYAQCIEALGGQGYMAENPITAAIRDATVERIWEGTPSVLSLDVARVHFTTQGAALREWVEDTRQIVNETTQGLALSSSGGGGQGAERLEEVRSALIGALDEIEAVFVRGGALTAEGLGKGANMDARLSRCLLDLVAIVECSAGMLEQTRWSQAVESGRITLQQGQEAADWRVEMEKLRRWTLGAEGGLADARRELRETESQKGRAKLDKLVAFGTQSIKGDGAHQSGQPTRGAGGGAPPRTPGEVQARSSKL